MPLYAWCLSDQTLHPQPALQLHCLPCCQPACLPPACLPACLSVTYLACPCQVCAQWQAKAKSPDAGYLWTQLLAAFAEELGAPDGVPAVKGELALLMQAFVGEVSGACVACAGCL